LRTLPHPHPFPTRRSSDLGAAIIITSFKVAYITSFRCSHCSVVYKVLSIMLNGWFIQAITNLLNSYFNILLEIDGILNMETIDRIEAIFFIDEWCTLKWRNYFI